MANNKNINKGKASLPNQNNISSTIKAQIADLTDIVDVVVKAINTKGVIYNDKTVTDIKIYSSVVKAIFDSNGVITSLVNAANIINPISNASIKNLDLILITVYNNICDKIISLLNNIKKIGDIKTYKKNLNTIKVIFKNIISLIDFISTKLTSFDGIKSKLNLKILETTYAKVIETLSNVSKSLNELKISIFLPIKLLMIRLQFVNIKNFIDNIANTNNELIKSAKNCLNTLKKFKTIDTILSSMSSFFTAIYNIKINLTLLKFKLIRTKIAFKKILNFIKNISKIFIPVGAIINVSTTMFSLKLIFNSLSNIITTVRTVKVGLKFIWKMAVMKLAVSSIINFTKKLNALSKDKNTVNKKVLISIVNLTVVIHLLTHLFRVIRGAKVGLFVQFKLLMLKLCINSLISVIFAVKTLAFDKRQIVKLTLINIFINKLTKIFRNLSISLPVLAISLIALLLIKICIKTLNAVLIVAKTLSFNKQQIRKINTIKLFINKLIGIFTIITLSVPLLAASVISLTLLLSCVLILFGTLEAIVIMINSISLSLRVGMKGLNKITKFILKMSLSMIILSLAAIVAIPAFIPIIIFMGMFVLISGMITSIGYLIVLASPILLPAIAGLGILTLMIVAIGVVALVLKGIEMLKLDGDKIKENVDIVLSTAKMIINSIFGNYKDPENKESKKGFITSIIEFAGGSLATILKSVLSIAFLATTLVSICIILIISIQLRLIQMLDLDPNKIKENVNTVITSAILVIDSIFNRQDTDSSESNKPWIIGVIENFGGTLSTIVKAIMSVAFLATTLIAIQLVLIISMQLRLLQILNLDPDKIKTNVDTVIGTVLIVIDALFNRKDTDSEETHKSWIADVINFIGGPIVKIAQAIMAIKFLAVSIVSIMLISVLAKQLQTIAEINLPDDITGKVNSIIIAADQVTEALFNKSDIATGETNKKKKGFLSKVFSGLGNAIDMIASLPWLSTAMVSVGMVSKLAEQLTTINNIPDVTNIVSKTEAVCSAADSLIKHLTTRPETGGDIEGNSRIDIIDKINMSIQSVGDIKPKQLKTINSIFDDYSKFIDKVNTVDITKLETSARMFEQMAKFSSGIQGDFTKLAETLNENLMPVLLELKNIMGEIPDKLDTGFQNTSASIAATTVAPTTETVTAQVNRENPTMTKKEVDNIVQQRMKDYSKTESTGIGAKLDQLIDLLKGYSGENVMVKTI